VLRYVFISGVVWRELTGGMQVYGEATIIFPLLVAATFAKVEEKGEKEKEGTAG
jgi:deoxyhypusine synthase